MGNFVNLMVAPYDSKTRGVLVAVQKPAEGTAVEGTSVVVTVEYARELANYLMQLASMAQQLNEHERSLPKNQLTLFANDDAETTDERASLKVVVDD